MYMMYAGIYSIDERLKVLEENENQRFSTIEETISTLNETVSLVILSTSEDFGHKKVLRTWP